MTFSWWLVPIIVAGVALILAPMIGAWWARREFWTHCPRCGVDLLGNPPEHRRSDQYWCRLLAYAEGERL